MARAQPEMVPLPQVAEELEIHYNTALKYAKLGLFPFEVLIVKKLRAVRYWVSRRDLDAYIKIMGKTNGQTKPKSRKRGFKSLRQGVGKRQDGSKG